MFLAIHSCWKTNFDNISTVFIEKEKIYKWKLLLLYWLRNRFCYWWYRKNKINGIIEVTRWKEFFWCGCWYQYIATVIVNFVNTSYWCCTNHGNYFQWKCWKMSCWYSCWGKFCSYNYGVLIERQIWGKIGKQRHNVIRVYMFLIRC